MGYAAADATQPHQPERLSHQFCAHRQPSGREVTGSQLLHSRLDLLGHCQHQGDRVFGGRFSGTVRRVAENDAMAGGGIQVYVVDADTGAHQDAQIGQPVKDVVVVADGGGGQNCLGRPGTADRVSRIGDQPRDRLGKLGKSVRKLGRLAPDVRQFRSFHGFCSEQG